MKFKPILYSTPMVQAIIEDCKTQTRRIVKEPLQGWMSSATNPEWWNKIEEQCKYQPGDILWVRESWNHALDRVSYCYKADTDNPIYLDKYWKWKPSIHMPAEACRLWQLVKKVRVERLQDISEADAIAEGIICYPDGTYKNYFTKKGLREQDGVECLLPIASYQSLICKIHGIEIWELNPFVWVIEFENIHTPPLGWEQYLKQLKK